MPVLCYGFSDSMKERELPAYEPQTYWTPEQVIQFYEDHDTPLHRDALTYHLEKLAGTSFLHTAVAGMTHKLHIGEGHPEYPMLQRVTHAGNLYNALKGMNTIEYFTGQVADQEQRTSAIAAMQTALLPPFSPTNVYEYQTIRPEEMMVDLWRTDDVFTDTQDGYAYTHLARQLLFFKQGVMVDGIALSTVSYNLPSGHGRMHSILLEGLHEVDYFLSPAKNVLSFVPPTLQRFNDNEQRSHTSLFIGPGFTERQASYEQPHDEHTQGQFLTSSDQFI